MKNTSNKLIIFLYLFLTFENLIQAEEKWTFLTPYPTVNDLNYVKFLYPNTIITVGNNGTILKSYDFANTWNFYESSPYNLNYNFNSIDIDKNGNGFLGYQNLVYKVTNYGNNYEWTDKSFKSSIKQIYYHTSNIIFVIGDNGTLSRSYNRGENWIQYFEDTNQVSNEYNFTKIKFYDNEYGYLIGEDNLIFQTTNSGLSWFKNNSLFYDKEIKLNYHFKDILIKDNYNWLILTETGQILSTKNGGDKFTLTELNNIYKNDKCLGIREIYNKNTLENYYLIFTSNTIFKTTDFVYLEPVLRNNDVTIQHFDILDNQLVLVGKNGLVYYSDNYGLDWELKSKYSNLTYTKLTNPQMKFIDDNIGFILDSFGNRLFKSTNQGLNWELDKTFDGLICNNMHFINNKVGFITCNRGKVLKTTDGGLNWDTLRFDFKTNVLDIKFADEKIGIIYNSSEQYQYWTYDGGDSWQKDSMIVDELPKVVLKPMSNIWFINDTTWYRYSLNGSIFDNFNFISRNKGKTWEMTNSYSELKYFNKLYKVDSFTYFGINNDGIYESFDGARSFKKRNYPYADSDLLFTDNQTGYAIGSNRIYKTTNKGTTWEKLYTQHNGFLTNIHFFNNGKGIISGSDGVILTNEVITTSVEDNNMNLIQTENNFIIFPNPSSDKISVDLGGESVVDLVVYDILGNEIMIIPNYTNKSEIDISNLSIGTYTIQIQKNTGSKSQRFVKY